MAIDGSFRVQHELERFLLRCPKLATVPHLSNLINKGKKLTEEELIDGVAQLLLHPRYTIPLVGCFRPIVRKIVDRVVALLHMVPDLTSNSNDSMLEFDGGGLFEETASSDCEEDTRIINLYVNCHRGLRLHELVCLAFSRTLDLVPYLSGSVREYFKFAPSPFKRFMETESISQSFVQEGAHILDVVRVSYRLLLAEPEVFSRLWDWSCFLDLVHDISSFDGEKTENLMDNLMDTRWCMVQILTVVLKTSDRFVRKNNTSDMSTSDFGFDEEKAFWCLLRWKEYIQDVSLEKASWYLEPFRECTLDSSEEDICVDQGQKSQLLSLRDMPKTGRPFVLTSAVKKSFEMVLLAVSQRWPVLLYGPAGSGKTALISRLAQDHGSRVLSIHMDEQIDGKTLIGSYVCAEQPGEFRWQPGSLTQAILQGLWVVFEDIDKAPADVQSILLPLLEGSSSFLTGHGEAIRVGEGFRLFSTVSSSSLDAFTVTAARNSLGALWRRVMVGPPSSDDLSSIVKAWYPDLESICEKLIETFEKFNQPAGFQLGSSVAYSSVGRFSLRDLLKWCKRIVGLGFRFVGDDLSTYVARCIYQEAVDVFATSSSSVDMRLRIMKELAEIWGIPVSSVNTLYPVDKPVVQDLKYDICNIGRVALQRKGKPNSIATKSFVEIRTSLHILERVAGSVKYNEPVLLVGETGTGKTTLVQNLAARVGQKLIVLNLSQQSDIADLLGGFKPMNAQFICFPLYKEFENLFISTFSSKDNEKFLAAIRKSVSDKNWNRLFTGLLKGAQKVTQIAIEKPGSKRKRPLSEELIKKWDNLKKRLEAAHAQMISSDGMVFSFVEGVFITALRKGHWILLDEVNLAPPETLQRILGVLEDECGSLCLAERGDMNYISRDPSFRIFACMNPATDAGKRDLPLSLRSRFTEYFMDDVMEDDDLILFINNQFKEFDNSVKEITVKVLNFYKLAKKESEERLQDGANQKPQYSLRSLYRALEYVKKARKDFGLLKAIYDGFSMFFLTMLDVPSAKLMKDIITKHLLDGKVAHHVPFDKYIKVAENFKSNDFVDNYQLTDSVKGKLSNLARAIFIGRYPVLLQGPTSSGKTSLVQYLAAITGHEFVRINNHEHTDLQEYLGSYVTDANGKLVFQEGVLVKAVRNGYWIVLDELNLAPSDVLEALNRLLDDNRELYVPELCETIRADPKFMLFATQNPPTFYGGRKMLSRAFRNRFVEIHVDEIPQNELVTILEKRCKIAPTYAKKMIDVMKDLQVHRQSSKVFAGKHGFITPRDLFRWADRYRMFGKSYEDLGRDGYYLLAERLRDDKEKKIVQEVLEKHLRIKLSSSLMYKEEMADGVEALQGSLDASKDLGRVVWTDSMWRLYYLVERCYKLREPVLLVGETGGGKTTVCQLLSIALGSKLHILNCHQYTETSDFLGGFYPVRERSELASDFKVSCERLQHSKAFNNFPDDVAISFDINQASTTINQVTMMIKFYEGQGQLSTDVDFLKVVRQELSVLHQKWCTIFNWQDGPLVQAMKNGDLFLVDEISLADDSVLERLNSVLEPERKLSLAEKGGSELEKITAHEKFFVLATMNPGGDYGKKELSPALRNRFTEIWVPSVCELTELRSIALEKISISDPELSRVVANVIINFWEWFNQTQQTGRMLTVRDLLSWIDFINVTEKSLRPEVALLHGAFLVLLDGLSLGTGISKVEAGNLREECLEFLFKKIKSTLISNQTEIKGWSDLLTSSEAMSSNDMDVDSLFKIDPFPFYIEKGEKRIEAKGFEFLAPTTRENSLRVLRAMQLKRPVLLEGSPGVGKTSLVLALGKFSGHSVVRINLSEQTDMMDLLGSDLPVESDDGMQFAWSDGILLQALKNGSWVLLDELNLAPQSVLEGLNAILDHRAEVFIPELGHTFKCPSSFRVFACQNPSTQGGGRKGLPKSFLNRFTKVYVDELDEIDHNHICKKLHPSIPVPLLSKLITFNKRLYEDTMVNHKFGQSGSPWEFNLRDVIRSCQIIEGAPESSKTDCFLNTVYVQRMRSSADRQQVVQLYEQVFGVKPFINLYPRLQLDTENLIIGNTFVKRNNMQSSTVSSCDLKILPGQRQILETIAQCLHHQWLVLLIGPAASGKTSLIRLMAQLTGNVLNELNLSSATDISELLGCFEQYNAIRHYRLAIEQVDRYMNAYMSVKSFTKQKGLIAQWLSFTSRMDHGSASFVSSSVENWIQELFKSLPFLVDIIEILKSVMEKDIEDLDRLMKIVKRLQDDQEKQLYPAKFEWVTGLLIKAIENGEWIVLENANLCNPTVLDRINSLVEQSGSITVNECGSIDGKPMVLRPHPNFRMFLTVNPTYGEVSRAMRNRGVEIYLMQPYCSINGGTHDENENELKDVKRFLVLSNIPGEHLVEAMAKAHLCAKMSGLQHKVNISNLELMRWVQLFNRLLTNGNQAYWSLKISFEHTYLSSLGELEGKYVVDEVLGSYLSMHELYNHKSYRNSSLCLPGGWPTTLMVRDYVWYSIESSVKQNCMYVEYLGSQIASNSFQAAAALGRRSIEHVGCNSDSMTTYVTDLGRLHDTTYPKADVTGLGTVVVNQTRAADDVSLTYKKLSFAANWTIEQATTEHDLNLYLLWFKWIGDHLNGYCSFFSSFIKNLNEELCHSIWNCIKDCHKTMNKNLVSSYSTPMLSLDYANLNSLELKSCSQRFANAVKCIGFLRVSYQQWHAESEFKYGDKTRCFIPVLESLRRLEERVLDMLVDSPLFDVLFELYGKLIDDHVSAWNGIVSSHFDSLPISWRSLLKTAKRLKEFCAKEEVQDLEGILSVYLDSQKSLLWAYGGHPFSPSSFEIYTKQQQLINLCRSVWNRDINLLELDHEASIQIAVSTNPEIRRLAMEGVCMSTYIMSNVDEDNLDVLQQMEEMYLMFSNKLHYEKDKLEKNKGTNEQDPLSCCMMNSDMLCQPCGLSCWVDTVPLNDNTSFGLDMRLLQMLSKDIITLDDSESESGLSCLRGLLKSAIEFSLNMSSRPPTDFSPYQKISWVHGAGTCVQSAHASVSSTVLELWFNWHTSLWTHRLNCEKKKLSQHDYADLVPDMLFQPVTTLLLDKFMQNPIGIKDKDAHKLKLGVASRNLWQSSPHVAECHSFFLSSARSLFQQIILAHEKSFEADKFSRIKNIFSAQKADVSVILSLLTSSTHRVLVSSIDKFIKPLLRELYAHNNPTDSLFEVGCAWLRIGGLRYRLLQCCDDVDPAVKKNFKYEQLTERITSLELDIQVRNECVHLSGISVLSQADTEKAKLLNNLKAERDRLRRQVVFRSDPGKFKNLRSECNEFLNLVAKPFVFLENMGSLNMQQVADQVYNWQQTATRFVDRLSNEFPEYVDIVQPIQVAIYEMKLGLSLVLSSGLHKGFSNRAGRKNVDDVLGAVHSFVRFPRGMARKFVSDEENNFNAKLSNFDKAFPTYMGEDDIKLMNTLITSVKDNNADHEGSDFQLKASIQHNILLRVVDYVAQARFLDKASFKLLDDIFNEFVNDWMKMKIQVKNKEELESQQYRIRPRTFDIKNVIELDVSSVECSITNEAFSEWQELASEEIEESVEKQNTDEEHEVLEKEWNHLAESMLNKMVNVYITVFGSANLLQPTGYIQVSASDKLNSFLDSYNLGTMVIKDLQGLLCSSLDQKLIPEHVLRLCLEHDRKSVNAYNFYKDSNASSLKNMVDPVMDLQKEIRRLLSERDDNHPALQKIVDITDMILSIPWNTPLAKAMSGLQFLLNRVHNLQETVSKFPLSKQLDPLIDLVSSWQKMELDTWPTLLDEVQAQFDTNAGQLWFSLYSLLRQSHSTNTNDYSETTMKSLNQFFETSSIGEFRMRLQLVFAFHGHISTAINQESNLSRGHDDNMKILYNTFGDYIQFLPIILEKLASNRKNIDGELKELKNSRKWDMETSKKTREKFKKLILKYTDVLKQPVLLILSPAAALCVEKPISANDGTIFCDSFEKYKRILDVACHETNFDDRKRFTWPSTWRNKLDLAIEIVKGIKADYACVSLEEAKGNVDNVSKFIDSQSSSGVSKEEWTQVQYTLQRLGSNVIDCGEIWKDEKRKLAKQRAHTELLKLLKRGLSKHTSTSTEDESVADKDKSGRWFLQPSYIIEHLLLKENRLSSENLDVAALEKARNLSMDSRLETDWKTANEYFFKSISSLVHLRLVCSNFHEDFKLDEVNRSVSYIDHLVEIQKSHRVAAYNLAEGLDRLKKRSLPLQSLFSNSSGCSFSHNQEIVYKCMQRQKQLFDTLCNTLDDECLLLSTVENNHDCKIVGAAACRIRLLLEKFSPEFKISKDLLDNYLFGDGSCLINTSVVLYRHGITKQMEDFVQQNFLLIRDFKEQLRVTRNEDVHAGLAKHVLLDHFGDIVTKGINLDEYYHSALEAKNKSVRIQNADVILNAESQFTESVRKVCKLVMDGFDRIKSVNDKPDPEDINTWQSLFTSRVENLQLQTIHDELVKTLDFAADLYGNEDTSLDLVVEAQLKHLYSLLDLMITFGNGLLNDFMVAHRTLSMITHALAEIFASLYSQGFGCSIENQEEENGTQDATGTGMGEGAGIKDVSDQIEDEDQLLGTEKGGEEQDAQDNVPSKNDKGIEMDEDFKADAFDLSEDENDEENDDDEADEPELDSAMGETGDDSEVVDEKLQDKKDDENDDDNPDKKEKYETGPSVKDDDSSGRELRAKEEDDDMANTDEAGELDRDESNKPNDDNDDQDDDMANTEDVEAMNLDKDEAFAEPTGLKPDEPDAGPDDDIDMNQQDDDVDDNEGGTETVDESAELNDGGDENNQENVDETVPDSLAENNEMDTEENNNQDKNTDADMEKQKNDITAPVANDFSAAEHQENNDCATQPNNGSNNTVSMSRAAPEATWSNTNDTQSELAPIQGLPNSTQNEISVADPSKGGKVNDEHVRQLPEVDNSSVQKNEPNPLRNIGDALESWKERAKVSVDLEENKDEVKDEVEVEDEDANEYGFTSGLDKGSAQALGSAENEQIDKNLEGKEPNDDNGDGAVADKMDDDSEMDIEEQNVEAKPVKNKPLNIGNMGRDKMEVDEKEIPDETLEDINNCEDYDQSDLESSVYLKRSYMTEEVSHFGQLSVADDDDMGMSHKLEYVYGDNRDSATALWRKYELQTTRLSQELAEQLRLVMEPTLASKLQGDYKTGKRINMKKVIPYIASHYRKDKIWLRRTRPNKRNYQVVIAVDDSRSMSENNCGNVAMEALVTVCRAMSQLEVGNLAVASFGKKGNIQLLHDFDQPFTSESGIKMLSGLTFKQENTIEDAPMVDLMKYLNNTLDSAVMNARLPSGQNPLEQLVLIIADGRLHEKENLKRCVRDMLSKKRMVAFLILDNPKESITEVMKASFNESGKCDLDKYMNSFPFPFYVILKDIENLPRTLADLLRQWFELMQNSGA
ncbi:midasin isoform X2 [Rutidosis leptorrhynchoides]|uniref:midasin isoform X2 n=1 Tax=Rutidosis leptorrhynchoides TaxID=125765 RepID=UPI003A99FC07